MGLGLSRPKQTKAAAAAAARRARKEELEALVTTVKAGVDRSEGRGAEALKAHLRALPKKWYTLTKANTEPWEGKITFWGGITTRHFRLRLIVTWGPSRKIKSTSVVVSLLDNDNAAMHVWRASDEPTPHITHFDMPAALVKVVIKAMGVEHPTTPRPTTRATTPHRRRRRRATPRKKIGRRR